MWPLRSNARASGPRGYATTSSVLAIVLVAGSFDRFVNSRPAALLRRAYSQRRPGAMTPKIARFLAQQQPATPCLVLDVDRVEENFRALQRVLPLVRIYYAVKANPARPVLERLVAPRLQLRRGQLGGSLRLPGRWRAPGGDQLRQHHQEGLCDPLCLRARRDAVRVRFGRGTGKACGARTRRARLLPHPGGERGRRMAAVAQVRHHDRECARADGPSRRDGAGSIRPFLPRRQPADHDARL